MFSSSDDGQGISTLMFVRRTLQSSEGTPSPWHSCFSSGLLLGNTVSAWDLSYAVFSCSSRNSRTWRSISICRANVEALLAVSNYNQVNWERRMIDSSLFDLLVSPYWTSIQWDGAFKATRERNGHVCFPSSLAARSLFGLASRRRCHGLYVEQNEKRMWIVSEPSDSRLLRAIATRYCSHPSHLHARPLNHINGKRSVWVWKNGCNITKGRRGIWFWPITHVV